MKYREFTPCDLLKPYIKCYYIFESDTDAAHVDTAFATGSIEVMFNLGSGQWQTAAGSEFITTPPIELWGQVISPLAFRTIGKNLMLGVRFFPHAASLFLNEDISSFNNKVSDLQLILGTSVSTLHSQLLEASDTKTRIETVEQFLLSRYITNEKKIAKLSLVGQIINELKKEDFFDNIQNVASRYGITSRYLQKLFLRHIGLTPKLYSQINRFQNSLLLVAKKEASLTSIAYECGYFDQSHFIREFKTFTGLTPSDFLPGQTSALLASPNK